MTDQDYVNIPWDGFGYLRNIDFDIENENDCFYRADLKLIEAVESIGIKNPVELFLV